MRWRAKPLICFRLSYIVFGSNSPIEFMFQPIGSVFVPGFTLRSQHGRKWILQAKRKYQTDKQIKTMDFFFFFFFSIPWIWTRGWGGDGGQEESNSWRKRKMKTKAAYCLPLFVRREVTRHPSFICRGSS